MKLIKNENLKYLLVGIIIVLIFFLTSVKSKGQEQYQEPITYDFNNDSILNVNQNDNINTYNIKEQSRYTMDYIAGFTYENDWNNFITNNNSESNSGYRTVDNIYGHNDVIEFYTSGTTDYNCSYTLNNQSDCIIEFWMYTNNTNRQSKILFLVDGIHDKTSNKLLTVRFINNLIRVHYGNGAGGTQYSDWNCLNNTWYHMKFNISFVLDTFAFYFNNYRYLNDETFVNDQEFDSFNTIQFASFEGSSYKYSLFLDGFDISSYSNFVLDRNFFPKKEKTNKYEVNKYEFDYDNDIFENKFTKWKQFEKTSSSNDILIVSNDDIDNSIIVYSLYGSTYTHGIEYSNIGCNSMVVNFTYSIEFKSIYANFFTYFDLRPYNSSTYDIRNRWSGTGSLRSWDIDLSAWSSVYEGFDVDKIYDVEIYINYYEKLALTSLYYNNELLAERFQPIDINNEYHYGLKDVLIYTFCQQTGTPSSQEFYLYNVGIYQNGMSEISNNITTNKYDFGLMYYDIDDDWNSDYYNLLTIDTDNYYKLFVNSYANYFKDGYIIRDKKYQNKSITFNLQDNINNNQPKFIYNTPKFVYQLFGNCTIPYETKIEGIQLIDNNDNIVYGNYYYNNTDLNYNWFYVIDNKLYYNFNNNDSSGLETMRISFDINDILVENGSLISYSSYITNNYSGYINIDSYYERETFDIFNNDSLVHSFLNLTDSNHFIVKEIVIELQSTYYSYNLSKGFIQNINIYPEKPLFPDFKPIEYLESTFLEKMIETIIPMLFFIIPSIILRTRYGNKSVIPMWILLTFVFLIVNFIPFWICFIIFLAIGLMVINKDKEVIE